MTAEMCIPLHDLRKVTNGFSVDSRIGQGGYGDVYRGVYNGREVAVKLLHVDTVQGIDDQQYINEVGNLLRAKHPNIVQLLGYSYETVSKLVEHNDKEGFSQHIYRALCFEYLHGGSLDKRLPEESFAPHWSTRFMIIKGICEGLDLLHRSEPQIFHLDLKPANILLDSSMVPKVADFGLSRVISQSHTQVTKQIKGTQAYMPPEFIKDGYISHKNDVFSLGLAMIEIMTGSSDYSGYKEMEEAMQLTQKVLSNWKNRIETTSEYPLEELHQLQTCVDTAMHCVEPDRNNRPTIAEVLDILNKTETHIPKRQMNTLLCPTIGAKNTESNILELMIAELDNISNKDKHCNSMARDSYNNNIQHIPDRETTSDVEEALIIGRTGEKQEIFSILSESIPEETVILPIFGIGGIGKTTLAQLVFNDPKFQDYSQVWVYVSKTLNLNKIGNSIISQLTDEISQISSKQMLHNRLRKLFAGKSILIVLDDLWEEDPEKLNELMTMLKLGTQRKVIVIVTTRDEAIAKIICGPSITHKLEILTDDMCWTIIKQKTAFKDRVDKKKLEQIGMGIAIKCAGVALAAHSLGYMLSEKTFDIWVSVRDNCIWNLSTRKDPSSRIHKVLASLLLSYSHMPDWLKLCFSYCAIFPKGHCIVKHDLVHQWIALGFIEQSDMFDPMQLCENYVRQLLGMSFLQYSKTSSISALPELIGDMKGLMHLNLSGCDGISKLLVSFKELRQLVHLDISHCHISISESMGGFTKLQYLNLSVKLPWYANHIRGLPALIGSLIKLRYLNLSGCLQVMALSQDQIHSLLCSISTLSNLEHLDLSNNKELSTIPESIGNLRKLHTLDLSSCFDLEKLPDSMVEMVSLKVLNVTQWFRWDESMLSRLNFPSLPHFVVHASNDKCGSNIVLLQPTNPDTLTIDGLENVKSAEAAQRIKLIDKQKIKALNFYWTVAAERFVDDRELLEKLVPPSSVEIMFITGYKSLSLPDWLMDIRLYLPNIFKLDLWHFPRCNELPPLGQLPNLQRLGLCHMGSLEEWNTIHSSGEECANELMFPKLEEWTINQCAKLRIKPCLPRARSLCIVECDNMLLSCGESSSRNSASSSSPITELTIHGSKAPLHQWKLLHHLPALHSLTIASCSDLTTSPKISQHLTSLESLSLSVRHNDRSELPTWLFELTSLQQLKICHPKLEKLDEDTRKLTRLQSLSLSECESMTSLPDSIQRLTNLEYLNIHGCPTLMTWCKSRENKMKLAHIREVHISYPRTANAPGVSETFLGTLHESRVDNKGKMPMIVEETFDVPTNMDDAGHKSAAPVMDGTVIDDEVHPDDVLYTAVMEVPGFTEEALSVAVSHLMDNNAQASAYMAMQEEKRVSWLMNFLRKHHY